MASASRIGDVRIRVDGSWDISDLLSLSESLAESYGLFYPLVAEDDEVIDRLHGELRKKFWSGDTDTRHFGRVLYRQIPKEESLRLKSFSYSSPGSLEIAGILSCLWLLAKIAQGWLKAGDELLSLWVRVEKYFEHRKSLKRPRRETKVDADLADSVDEARSLCFEVGEKLGFDPISCEHLISITGNPISALKYLAVAGAEGRKLAELQKQGLLELPESGERVGTINPGKSLKKARTFRADCRDKTIQISQI